MLLLNLDLLATAPGGVARLRELILTLAVQGKLLPQDPADEPASALLKKIRAEKDRLIADGKIKRDKPLAGISEEEQPFEVPAGWEWVRCADYFVELCTGPFGSVIHQEDYVFDGVPLINPSHMVGGRIVHDPRVTLKLEDAERLSAYALSAGDLVLARRGEVGRYALVTEREHGWLCGTGSFFVRLHKACNREYLGLLFTDARFRQHLQGQSVGTTMTNLNQRILLDALIALPPLAEQSRIVTRVEELMRLCDALEAKGRLEAAQHAQLVSNLLATLTDSATPEALTENWQRLATHFDTLLDRPSSVDALEQTILQLAVRGLLVPQDPADEPASVLLKHIRSEKDRLIAAGQIKRDKPLEPIADGEKPFDLPEGWAWARFPELGEFGRGKSKHRPRNDPTLFNPPKYPLIQTGEVSRADGVVREVHSYYSDIGLAQSRIWPKGTLCITIAANIAESAILGFDSCFPDSVVGFVPADAMGNVEYFLLFVETAKADLLAFAPATAQKNINLEILSSLLIPVPPRNELTRIVARVAALRRLCADLRQRLAASQTAQAQLAGALVESVSN
jgi:type I restriction enzyme S subunit